MRYLSLFGVLAVLFQASCTPSAGARPHGPEDAFLRLNHTFRELYKESKAQTLRSAGPVIVTGGQKPLTLVYKGRWETATYIDSLVERLKTIAHVPLALTVLLENEQSGLIALGDGKRDDLVNLRAALADARAALAQGGFDTTQLARQERIVAACDSALGTLLSPAGMQRVDFDAFVRQMTPLVMDNVDDAARRMLDNINKQVTAWRGVLGDDWKDLRVVVSAPHMPRAGLMEGRYFERLLNDKGDERRLYYREGVGSTEAALDFLGTHLVDTSASQTFFNDPQRLHRDVLADATTRYLGEMTFPAFP